VPGARCDCERAAVAACATIPTKIAKKAAAVCTTLDRAAKAAKPKTRRKLLKKAVHAWKALAKLVGKPAVARKLSAECVAGLKAAYGDAAGRADRAVRTP
jgi:2,4-dienoyl-CoA reductase-like NADH-dependent reductase (Old Yellow Enzyme family)